MLTLVAKESALEGYLVSAVKARGGKCLKFVSPGNAGVADRLVILPGVIGFLELKRLGEEPTPLQQKFLRDMARLAQVAGWADTQDRVDAFLEQLEARRG